MDGLVAELLEGARAEMAVVAEHGGAVKAVDYMKAALVDSHRERIRRIESRRADHRRRQQVHRGRALPADSPTPTAASSTVDPEVEAQQREAIVAWRAGRDAGAVDAALAELARVAQTDENIMAATIAAARAGVTTGEWAQALREAFGAFRGADGRRRGRGGHDDSESSRRCARRSSASPRRSGRRPKILVGKPGLDGHSNGAEQIAVRARDIGMDVVYEGIRLTPAQIAAQRAAGGRPRGRPVDPLRLAPRADPRRRRGAARARRRRRRSSSAGSSPRPTSEPLQGGRRRRGLHARRTSTSRGSWATSSRSWPSATALAAAKRERGRRARRPPARARPERRAGGAQPRRERDARGARADGRAAARGRPGRARRRGARRTSSASPARRARASRRC